MTQQESEKLYSQIRANALARHFAIGRYFRRNIMSQESHLGNRISEKCEKKPEDSIARAKKADGVTYLFETSRELIDQSVRDLRDPYKYGPLNPERWRVARHEAANPLLQTGMQLVQLAIEAKLGNNESKKIIELALATIKSLYKFENDPVFSGYILRFDPVTCDEWFEDEKHKPFICCKFLPNLDPETFKGRHYNYSTPDNNSVIEKNKPTDIVEVDQPPFIYHKANNGSPGRFRFWEPSFDEITGLLGGYFMIWYCLKDDASTQARNIVDEVRRQSDKLGNYLKETSYMLVKPNKGFTYYGCTGVGSMLEIIYSRVFARINDKPIGDYRTNYSFEYALKLAGVWTEFNDMITNHIPPLPPGMEFPIRPNLITDPLLTLNDSIKTAFDSIVTNIFHHSIEDLGIIFSNPDDVKRFEIESANILLNTTYVLANYQVFDVGALSGKVEFENGDPRFEFAIGYLIKRLMMINERDVYKAYFLFNNGFKPWLGLFSLGDKDPFFKTCYLEWFSTILVNLEDPRATEVEGFAVNNKGFFTAVALLLDDNNVLDFSNAIKWKLNEQLTIMYEKLRETYKSDLYVYSDKRDDNGNYNGEELYPLEVIDNRSLYYGFTLPLSLKWLHYSDIRLGCFGSFFPWFFRISETPSNSSILNWPKSILPADVIKSLSCFTAADGRTYEPPLEQLPLEYTKAGISESCFRPRPGIGIHDPIISANPFINIDLFEDPVSIPKVEDVSKMPPPIIAKYPIDIVQFANNKELLIGITIGTTNDIKRTYRKPTFQDNAPFTEDKYQLIWSLETTDERGSSIFSKPEVNTTDNSISFTIRLKSYAEWINIPLIGWVPDVNKMQNAYYKGTLYYGWIFNY